MNRSSLRTIIADIAVGGGAGFVCGGIAGATLGLEGGGNAAMGVLGALAGSLCGGMIAAVIGPFALRSGSTVWLLALPLLGATIGALLGGDGGDRLGHLHGTGPIGGEAYNATIRHYVKAGVIVGGLGGTLASLWLARIRLSRLELGSG